MTYEIARAKVNMALHITGQRDDGYHLLDSLVMFADFGDRLDFASADTNSLRVEGPEAATVPGDTDNSILKALALLEPTTDGIAVLLSKHLPVASGIGGGSADAAAALRGSIRHCGLSPKWLPRPMLSGDFGKAELASISARLLALGADVPVCFFSRSCRMSGIGEDITPVALPPLPAVLVNPRVAVSTPKIFAKITQKNNSPMTGLTTFTAASDLVNWLATQRNDMQVYACQEAPGILTALDALSSQDGCGLSRMSGSGATCFGIFNTTEDALTAATQIRSDHPDWWVQPCTLGDNQLMRATT